MEVLSVPALVALCGFAGGIVLGLSARLGRFCTLGAIEDALFGGNYRRLRIWALALAVAMVGTAVLSDLAILDLEQSLYHQIDLNPVAWILGGLMFGAGMALCGTCSFGTLVRVGGGDLRALFGFLVIGIAAYMAIAGPTAMLRVVAINPFAVQIDSANSHTFTQLLSGLEAMAQLLPYAIAALLAVWCFSKASFRVSLRSVGWSIAAGLAIVSGWVATGWLGQDAFDPQPLASHTFSLPLGQTLIYAMTMNTATISFAIGSTLGVVVGAFLGAVRRGEFRWEGADDAREMRRHVIGALLMGTGGVYAGGCTIGQGMTAASLLAISAPVVLASIWLGGWLGLTYLMEGSIIAGIRALMQR